MKDDAQPASFSFEPLTPVAFLDRSAEVYANQIAVVDGELSFTYRELRDRSLRQARLLHSNGIETGDRVAVLAPNSHVLLESHYGVPSAGAVLVALNTRLAAAELVHIVKHADCKILLCDPAYGAIGVQIAAEVGCHLQLLVADVTYERALADGPGLRVPVTEERGLLALNYTSGTTGSPKGVMYHHRGAYLQSLAMVKHFDLSSSSAYLWTLPMFHCNGWCFTWAVTAAGGMHVCLPELNAVAAWQLIRRHSVTHFCAAPTVLTMLAASAEAALNEGQSVRAAVGGAPPAPSLIALCEGLGLSVTHLYGLTETFGPVAICDWKEEWDPLPTEERAVRRARQGVGNVISQNLRVVDLQGQDVPRDGATIGEIVIRGNNVMLGYYKDPDATHASTTGGWFHSGDLAVMHPDSYIEIRDRMKDIIISGGENVSSVEVESALVSHPAVLEAAVVATPNYYWGERPMAFVTLREGEQATEGELQDHVRSLLAGFKVPDRIIFGALPKTGTGKIQKFRLREIGRSLIDGASDPR
jgi:fatty-acyl-CoA synthase